MILKTLKLNNFRNYINFEIALPPIMLLIGNNAQGKSNFLEAIYFLATTKSPRVEKDGQLINADANFCTVKGEVADQEPTSSSGGMDSEKPAEYLTELEIVMQLPEGVGDEGRIEKRTKINGISRRVVDYIGNLIAIYFTPEDINLVAGSPSLRRWHIDITLAQIDKDYKKAITNYSNVLVARNRLLKQIKEGLAREDELTFWTNQLVENGQILTQKRTQFFEFLNNCQKVLGDFNFEYLSNAITPERLEKYHQRELDAATSLIGPHRDDFIFKEDNRNLAYFGSRGEQRTAVLNLKLDELQFITEVTHKKPLLLLDDVFSELDIEHRDYIASLVSNQQTIISAVKGENIPEKLYQQAKVYQVEGGVFTEKLL